MSNFSDKRIAPLNAITLAVEFNLVQVGGKSLNDLREDFYDQAFGASYTKPPQIVSAYDIALSGGEPYSVWL